MLQINQEKCIVCGACEAVCPGMECEERGFHKCVTYSEGQYEINCEECIDCNSCTKICPVGAVDELS